MSQPVWLTRAIVEALHTDLIREHGGHLGLRDVGLLESALAPEPDVDLSALAAEYGFGLARNHPFLDGNKRIAFVAMNVFLILNGLEIETSEPDVVATMVGLADGSVDRKRLGEWVRRIVSPVQ